MTLLHLAALVQRWGHVLRPPEFRLLVYLHRVAQAPDGVVSKPREEIAAATKIPPRNIRPMLKRLVEHEAIEVLSLAAEKTVVRLLVKHGSSFAPAVPRAKPVDPVATIKQLVLRMTGQRPGLEEIREMEREAGGG